MLHVCSHEQAVIDTILVSSAVTCNRYLNSQNKSFLVLILKVLLRGVKVSVCGVLYVQLKIIGPITCDMINETLYSNPHT